MNKVYCVDCIYCYRYSVMECRFNPPKAVEGRDNPYGIFPVVSLSYWCGQGKKK